MIVQRFIREQPDLVKRMLASGFADFQDLLPNWSADRIYLVGTGSSKNAILGAVSCFAGQNAHVSIHSPMEFLQLNNPVSTNRVICIVVSQSGESIDTNTATRLMLKAGAHVIAVTAGKDSPLADLNPKLLILPVEDETIGPKTKGFFATLIALHLLGNALSKRSIEVDRIAAADEVAVFTETANDWARGVSSTLAECDVVVVVGQGSHVGTALEGSLKIAEMSGVPCFGLETEEASHGRFHCITDRSAVIFIASTETEMEFAQRLRSALNQFDLTSYIVDLTGAAKPSPDVDLRWTGNIKGFPVEVLAGVIPFQLLAVHMAEARGIVPEKMRYPDMGKYLGIKVGKTV
uniref:SIS domain-containing protein n=1 Tax=Pararhizobium sp. IMCC3301 TaxID=3067904 RepID=UPI002740F8BF|nr:SIS domain-containing protein [Pararhizobium sp. IMCC3301]